MFVGSVASAIVSLGVGGVSSPLFLMCSMARIAVTSHGSRYTRKPVTVWVVVHPDERNCHVGESGVFCPQYVRVGGEEIDAELGPGNGLSRRHGDPHRDESGSGREGHSPENDVGKRLRHDDRAPRRGRHGRDGQAAFGRAGPASRTNRRRRRGGRVKRRSGRRMPSVKHGSMPAARAPPWGLIRADFGALWPFRGRPGVRLPNSRSPSERTPCLERLAEPERVQRHAQR